jgi:hypothetical protein
VLKQKLYGLVVLSVVLVGGARPAGAQWADQRLSLLDALQAREEALGKLPHSPFAKRGTAGNLAAFAARWPALRPAFAPGTRAGAPGGLGLRSFGGRGGRFGRVDFECESRRYTIVGFQPE